MLCSFAVPQGMSVESYRDFEKARSSLYLAFFGAAVEPAGRFEKAGLFAGAALLCGIGIHRLLSIAGLGRGHFRLPGDVTYQCRRGFIRLPSLSGTGVGAPLSFQ